MSILFTRVEHAGIKATVNDVILGWVCTSINSTWVFVNSVSGEVSTKYETKEEAFDCAEKVINKMLQEHDRLSKAADNSNIFDIGKPDLDETTEFDIPAVGESFNGKMVLILHDNGKSIAQNFGMGENGVLVEQDLSVEITNGADSLKFYGFLNDMERKFLNSFIKVETRQIKS